MARKNHKEITRMPGLFLCDSQRGQIPPEKIQIAHLKKLSGAELQEELARANTLLRNIIFTLVLIDERITRGTKFSFPETKE